MADLVGVDASAGQRQRGLEATEGGQHALCRLAGRVEVAQGGDVGGGLFGALVAEQAAARDLGATDREARPGPGHVAGIGCRAGDRRAETEQGGYHGHRLRPGELVTQPLLMTVGQMAGLMGNDADDLVGALRRHQRPGVDEHAPAGDEGIEGIVVDQDDVDAGLGKTGHVEDRPHVIADECLDLRIANNRHAPALRLCSSRGPQGCLRRKNQRDRAARDASCPAGGRITFGHVSCYT